MFQDIQLQDLSDLPEEGDPLAMVRRHREELADRYPTVEALLDYYRSVPTVEELLAKQATTT